jgi:hypothetical protein
MKPGEPSDRSSELLRQLGRALLKPGLPRSSVFTGAPGVYAYSVHPDDPALLVREDEAGAQTVGVFRNGRFRPRKGGK